MLRISLLSLLVLVLFSELTAEAAAVSAESFSVAFYYAEKPPLDELQAFDIVVVDPDAAGVVPQAYKSRHSELFAYISVGEADPQRRFYKQIKSEWLIGDNPAWKSKLVDLANPDWCRFFLDQVVEPLWSAGYRGFFLDTLDSFLLVKDSKRHPALMAGLVDIIRSIKQRHPDARLILNRGFEVLDQVKDTAFAVAAESLFQKFDPVKGTYGDVQEHDRQWLLGKFAEVRKAGLPVIAIDYVAPKDRELARRTAARIKELGCIPWVTDKDLATLGIGAVEVLPRKILGVYDIDENTDISDSNFLRIVVTPLNYMGYDVELKDIKQPLPQGVLAGRYAGIVIWPASDHASRESTFQQWLKRQMNDGLKLVFLERFGIPQAQAADLLNLKFANLNKRKQNIKILKQSSLIGFEVINSVPVTPAIAVKISQGEPQLSLGTGNDVFADPVAFTSWGGYALEPYLIRSDIKDQTRWVINPFDFFAKALQLKDVPAADTTTENGVRLLLSHIDADGFESKVERPGGPLAATELRERILARYRIPTTYSVITSTLGDHGQNSHQAAELQAEARKIFALPWVEAGSHTFSHPFYWQNTETAKQGYSTQYLPIPGYSFSLDAEIGGSAAFINKYLLPVGKRTKLLQWSGDCTPGPEALSATYSAALGNINGGDTLITESNKSITAVAPLGVSKGGWFQVFAPNQNENVYTNLWTGPFYGYRRVIETFKLTDRPRRLKPINIYYHTYSATKEASRRALEDVYDWVLAQKPYPIFTSSYVSKVLDFNRTVVARSGDGWLVRNSGDLRQLRLPISAGYPDLSSSRGVIGFADYNDQRYIHLAPGGEAFLKTTTKVPQRPWLVAASANIDRFEWTGNGMKLGVTALTDGYIRFGGAFGCRLLSDGKPLAKWEDSALHAPIAMGSHGLELVCR